MTEKTDPVVVRIYVHTGYSGASYEYTHEIPRDEWDAMTPSQRREYLDDWAKTEMENRIEYGWSIEDPADYEATEGN